MKENDQGKVNFHDDAKFYIQVEALKKKSILRVWLVFILQIPRNMLEEVGGYLVHLLKELDPEE